MSCFTVMRPGSNSNCNNMMMNTNHHQHQPHHGFPPGNNGAPLHYNNINNGGMVGGPGLQTSPAATPAAMGNATSNNATNAMMMNSGAPPHSHHHQQIVAASPSSGLPGNNNNASTITNQQQQHPNAGNVRSCAGCGGRIQDRFLLFAMERYWHTSCLKCSCCQAQLGEIGTSCFTRAGMILCRNDYIRLFGSSGSCCGCGQPIPASELVMRAQTSVYHLKCFTCCSCHSPLTTGDRYGIVQGSLLCEHDFPKVVKGLTPLPNRTPHKVC